MPHIRVAQVSELPAGGLLEAEIEGRPVAVCNVDGELFAVGGICPHAGGRLAQGALHGPWIACPWHAWEFDCRSGQHDYNPDVKVEKYPVSVRDGEILIELPD